MHEEQAEQRHAGESRRPDLRAAPADDRLADQREHRPGQTEEGQHGAQPVHAGARRAAARAAGTAPKISSERDDDERDVDREDQPPRDRIDEIAADERADHGRDPGPGRPRADRRAALAGRERGDDERERARGEQRAERALQRAAGDQQLDARRDGAQHRDDAEAGDAEREDAPLAEDVAERAADQDQRAERQQVGVRDPLLPGQPAAEIVANRGQRDVDRRGVQPGDERAHDRREQRELLVAAHLRAQLVRAVWASVIGTPYTAEPGCCARPAASPP